MEKMNIFEDINLTTVKNIKGEPWWKVEGARIAKEKGLDIKDEIYNCKTQDEVNTLVYKYMKEGK